MIVNYKIYIYYVERFIKMSQTTLDIKEPGLNVLPPGVERHVVNAGGLTGLQTVSYTHLTLPTKA